MTDYRCYLLDGQGTIRAVETFRCADDAQALALARDTLRHHPHLFGLELWHRRRRVHTEINERRHDVVCAAPGALLAAS